MKHHLRKVHVARKTTEDEQVDKYFAMGLEGHKKRGTSVRTKAGKKMKGRWKRWYPQLNCHYLGPYLSDHLQNKHHMKPSSITYKTALMIALRYKGLKEEIGMMSEMISCHACQVKKLLEEVDPHRDDIVLLAKEKGNRALVDWVIPNFRKKKPGTLKSYLTSFQIFLDYVIPARD